jgi:hypothetical protein
MRIAEHWLLNPKLRHPDPRWEPGICAGGGEQSPSLTATAGFQRLRNHADFSGCCLENLSPAVAVSTRRNGRRAGALEQGGNTNVVCTERQPCEDRSLARRLGEVAQEAVSNACAAR